MIEFQIEDSIALLKKTPLVLRELLQGLSNKWIYNNEGENTWSPFDIVGHLIHGEKTDWTGRANIILNESPNKEFQPFDRFAQFEASKGKSLDDLLTEFSEIRQENIRQLEQMQIDEEKLKKTGIHPEFGEVTLKQLLATWVVHDLSHVNQITRVMAKNYSVEIGPWSAYISIVGKNKPY